MRWFTLATIAAFGLYWAYVVFTLHRLGNYGVETDFYWKYGPAAAALKQGRVLIEHFDTKGWGYPLVVAAFSFLGLDIFKAGQAVGLLSACAVAWCAFRIHRRLLGSTLAFLSVLLLLGNPTFVANVYEVGTDMFFFAMAAASIALLLGSERRGWIAIAASGLLAGWAFSTRYNGLFLWPAAVVALAALLDRDLPASARWKRAGLWSAGFLLAAAPWLIVNAAHTGNPLTNNNYTNVGFSVYGQGDWEHFFYGGDRKIHSFADVVRLDPGRFAGAMVSNTLEHLKRDFTELLPLPWGLFAAAGLLLVFLSRRLALWGPYLLCGLLYFLTLIPVFYGARFSLPMLAFYSALAIAPFGWDRLTRLVSGIERRFPIRILAFMILWLPGAMAAHARTQDPQNPESVQAGPYETLEAAEYLKTHAQGQTLLARKPHVAFIAGMRFAPIPQVDSPAALHRAARQAGAGYLLISAAEMVLRAGVRPLAQPDARVPGFKRVFESAGALVYEVLPDSTSVGAPAAP
ncbi:MAG TPA: glycosyltransferase family 39 protein [Candidatus Limnocylindrales bacterium]|nr:glycosyltransferase family 39 protein [Candidatus Limnocylindrales bacterium]